MNTTDPTIVAAVISAVVSLGTFILASLAKPFWEKYLYNFKLRADHKYEQRKRVKEAISKHKVRLLDSAESLNHRLWNFSENCQKGWHLYDGNLDLSDKYYLQSFCYRFLAFFAWCRKIEKEMVYLDSTISEPADLELIKYLKLFPQMFCDTGIFNGKEYDSSFAKDHFFKDDFLLMVETLITEDGIMSFSAFKSLDIENNYKKIMFYIGGVSCNQSCLRWHVLHAFHFLLMALLTKYGYDFQRTSKNKLEILVSKTPKNELLGNLASILNRNHLEKTREIKDVIKILAQT